MTTDIHQSMRLISAGAENADSLHIGFTDVFGKAIPSWSLGALWDEVSKYCKFSFDETDKPEDIIEALVSLYEQYKESRK